MENEKVVNTLIKTALFHELFEKKFVADGLLLEPTGNLTSIGDLYYKVAEGIQEAIFELLGIEAEEFRNDIYYGLLGCLEQPAELDAVAQTLLTALTKNE